MAGYVPVLLITANVGSIFEEPSVMLNIWTEEFLSTIARLDPKFIALHCQEVGGKNYEQSMRHVEYFVRLRPIPQSLVIELKIQNLSSRQNVYLEVKTCNNTIGRGGFSQMIQSFRHPRANKTDKYTWLLMSSEELRLFDKVRVFLDEDFSSAEHFTALGNFYFVHESLKDVLLWDFKESSFSPVSGKDVHSGNIEAVTTKEKSKFPQDFFPECKWSRKGFLRTRWSISGTVLDLINIHLFHDASNFVAMETFPSVYSKTRRRALEHTLDRFHNDHYPNVPYFLFGDFNFRTDTAGVIKKLTEDTQESKLPSKNNFSKLQFHNKDDHLILTLGKKEFSLYEHQHVFMENSGQWLREYDRELEDFEGRLLEFPITFLPSYPFEENIKEGSNYMKTRVPAWCDRVLLSPTAKALAQNTSASGVIEYGIIGPTTCMGDHKPVYLRISLPSDAGTVNCCHLANAPQFCFQVPDSYVDTLSLLPDCRSYLSKPVHIDHSANLLHAAPVKHDPYTPDSMDSPSPRVLVISGEVPDVDLLIDDCNEEETYFNKNAPRVSSTSRRINTAVSPALLKSKLELIVQSKDRDSKKPGSEIRKSPSECDLPSVSTSDKDTQLCTGVRKNRSNSDVSWQRSHLLTQAWIEGKGHQAYDYVMSNSKRESFSSLDSTKMNDGAPGDLVIPRIAIITASNLESNESSVHLHDDRHSTYSETRLSTYSDNRTKTLSGEASSLEKSDGINMIFEDMMTSDKDGTQFINVEDNTVYVSVPEIRLKEKFDEMYLDQDCNITCSDENKGSDKMEKDMLLESKGKDNTNPKSPSTEEKLVTEQGPEVAVSLRENVLDDGIEGEKVDDNIEIETRNFDEKYVEVVLENKVSVMPKIFKSQEGDVSVMNENVNTYGPSVQLSNHTDVLRSENRRDILGSRNTTRSNSTQSQDGNITLGLTARKVTEKCKRDIAMEKGKCRRCCCIIS